MASEFSSTVSPPRTELGLGTMPSTQLLATASMSNYAAERKYAQAHPTWHKPQIMHCPKPSGLPESRGVQVSACSGVHVPKDLPSSLKENIADIICNKCNSLGKR